MCYLIKRNLFIFFKDRSAVFFSLMAVFVVLGLYILFLGDLMIRPLESSLGDQARTLSDNWIMAGTLGTVALTTSMSALGIMIEDRSREIVKDFYISALKPYQIYFCYLLSAFIITMIIGLITIFLGQLYIVYYGGKWMTINALFQVIGIFALDTLMCGAFLLVLMSFFHSAPSFSNATTIIGTLSGFLMGIYIPLGTLPLGLQQVIKCFPPAHGAALMRRVMMQDTMKEIFHGYPTEVVNNFKNQFGLQFTFFDQTSTYFDSIVIMIITMIIFIFILLFILSFKKKHQ